MLSIGADIRWEMNKKHAYDFVRVCLFVYFNSLSHGRYTVILDV